MEGEMIKNLFFLEDKIILIIGGNGYLGKVMCYVLVDYGVILILVSRNIEKNK